MQYEVIVKPNSPEEAQALISFLAGGVTEVTEVPEAPEAVTEEPELTPAEKQELITKCVLAITQDADLKKDFGAKAKAYLAKTGIVKLSQVPPDKLDDTLAFLENWRAS